MPSRRHVLGLVAAGATTLSGCGTLDERDATRTDKTTPSQIDKTTTATSKTHSDEETPTKATDKPAAVTCEETWPGEPDYSFQDAKRFGRAVPSGERIFVGSDAGLLALSSTLEPVWKQPRIKANVYDVADGVVLTSGGNRVVAADSEQGEVLWSFEPPGNHARVAQGPAVQDKTVYVAASQTQTPSTDPEVEYGRLYALQLKTGSKVFVDDLSLENRELVQPRYLIADAAGVFVTLELGGLLGVTHDGTIQWRRAGDDWYFQPERVGSLILQPRSRSVVAMSAETGETQWESNTIEMEVTAKRGLIYGAGGGGPSGEGTLAALDTETGRSRWETPIQGCGKQPVVGSGGLAIPVGCRDDSGHVGLYDAKTGCRYGEYRQSADITAELATGQGRLYASVGENQERLLTFDLP